MVFPFPLPFPGPSVLKGTGSPPAPSSQNTLTWSPDILVWNTGNNLIWGTA